jgi:hypothetical protein
MSVVQYNLILTLKEKLGLIVCLIGDPNQNIYQFQGDSDRFLVEYPGKVYNLDKNYRSNKNIPRTRGISSEDGVLIQSLEKVAGEAEGENGGWKIKLIVFVGGTSGSVNVQTKALQDLESKTNAIRKGLVYELLNAQDTVLCSYFAQRSGDRSDCPNLGGTSDEAFQGLDNCE